VDDAGLDDSSRTHISRSVRSCGNFDIPEYGVGERARQNSPHPSAGAALLRFSVTRVIFSAIVISVELALVSIGLGVIQNAYIFLETWNRNKSMAVVEKFKPLLLCAINYVVPLIFR